MTKCNSKLLLLLLLLLLLVANSLSSSNLRQSNSAKNVTAAAVVTGAKAVAAAAAAAAAEEEEEDSDEDNGEEEPARLLQTPAASVSGAKERKGYLLPQNFPDIFIIGAQKSGTTSLNNLMFDHPQICSEGVKEKHFFDQSKDFEVAANYPKAQKEYLEEFKNCKPNQLTVDATPVYVFNEDSPYRYCNNTHTHTHTNISIYLYIHAYIHTYMHTHVRKYIHAPINI